MAAAVERYLRDASEPDGGSRQPKPDAVRTTSDWSLRSRAKPMPYGVAAALVGATLVLNAIPLLEENLRCRRMTGRLRRSRFVLR